MVIKDVLDNFRKQFNNVINDDERLNAIMLEVFIDIQKQTNIFKSATKIEYITENKEKDIKTVYNYDCAALLDVAIQSGIDIELSTHSLDDSLSKGILINPDINRKAKTNKAILNKVLLVLSQDFGPIPNATIKKDLLMLDKDTFTFDENNQYFFIIGSKIYYSFESINIKEFITIKNALYWGTLDKFIVSVSNANNSQMENLYYQRYYQAIQNIIKENEFIIDFYDYNTKINKFV